MTIDADVAQIMSDQRERMTAARMYLIANQPFFGYLAQYLRLTEMPPGAQAEMRTLATDGKTLWFDPQFTSKLENQELVFSIGHEVMHAAFRHPYRGLMMRDHHKYNIAGDTLINEILRKNNVGKPPAGICFKDNVPWKVEPTKDILEYSADELYYMLDENKTNDMACSDPNCPGNQQGNGQGQGQGNQPGKGHGHANGPRGCGGIVWDQDQADTWRARIEAGVKLIGNAPAGMEAYIDSVLTPKKNWREILLEFVAPEMGDYNLIPPDRRFLGFSQGGLLSDIFSAPLLVEQIETDEKVKDIVYAVDTSGSMSDDELRDAISEAVEIGKISNRAWLAYCDAAMQGWHELTEKMPPQPKGRGGTAFEPVFEHVNKLLEDGTLTEVKALVYFTDGYGYYNFPEPEYPVLWIVNNEQSNPPWGTVVRYP